MSIINYLLLTLFFSLTPWGVMWLCRRFPFLDKIGPIMLLYAIGVIYGNLPFKPSEAALFQEMLPNITIPLAIPMMLYGCKFTSSDAGRQIKVAVSGFLSVAIAVVCGYMLFGRNIEEGAEIGGIISGMYSGGTLNAAALQTIFNINSRTFVLINSYDIIISFLYFVFLFSCGIKFFRWIYGERLQPTTTYDDSSTIYATEEPDFKYDRFWSRNGIRELCKIIGVTLGVAAISGGIALLMPEGWFMVVFILMLTTLGVVCSFIKPVQRMERSYDTGMYLIYIFSLAIASMADFSNLDIAGGLNQIAFMSFAVIVSLFIHAMFCRLMRIDADSMIISSVAFINSPPFVPMASAAMRNKSTLVTGLSAGIIGYAVGNHFGVLMAELLSLL